MNKVMLLGRLARDPEVRTTSSGKTAASFTLAVNGYGKDAKSDFIPCIAWEKIADTVSKYMKKGSQCLVEGRIQVSKSENNGQTRYFTNVVVSTLEMCGGSQNAQKGSQRAQASNPTTNPTNTFKGQQMDAEDAGIPF